MSKTSSDAVSYLTYADRICFLAPVLNQENGIYGSVEKKYQNSSIVNKVESFQFRLGYYSA